MTLSTFRSRWSGAVSYTHLGGPDSCFEPPRCPALLRGGAPAAGIKYRAPNKSTASDICLQLSYFHSYSIFCIMVQCVVIAMWAKQFGIERTRFESALDPNGLFFV